MVFEVNVLPEQIRRSSDTSQCQNCPFQPRRHVQEVTNHSTPWLAKSHHRQTSIEDQIHGYDLCWWYFIKCNPNNSKDLKSDRGTNTDLNTVFVELNLLKFVDWFHRFISFLHSPTVLTIHIGTFAEAPGSKGQSTTKALRIRKRTLKTLKPRGGRGEYPTCVPSQGKKSMKILELQLNNSSILIGPNVPCNFLDMGQCFLQTCDPRHSAPGRKRMNKKEQARKNFTSAACSLVNELQQSICWTSPDYIRRMQWCKSREKMAAWVETMQPNKNGRFFTLPRSNTLNTHLGNPFRPPLRELPNDDLQSWLETRMWTFAPIAGELNWQDYVEIDVVSIICWYAFATLCQACIICTNNCVEDYMIHIAGPPERRFSWWRWILGRKRENGHDTTLVSYFGALVLCFGALVLCFWSFGVIFLVESRPVLCFWSRVLFLGETKKYTSNQGPGMYI